MNVNVVSFIKKQGGYVRAKDIVNRQMYDQLLSEVAKGNVIRIRSGIYALPEEMAKTMIDVERIIPGGVVCMYSAWAHYELTTKLPPDIFEKQRRSIHDNPREIHSGTLALQGSSKPISPEFWERTSAMTLNI